MDLFRAVAFAGRFAAALTTVVCVMGLVWRSLPNDFPSPAGCLAAGALASGMFAFVRGGQAVQAVALGAGAVSFQLAGLWYQGPLRALATAAGGLVEAGGIAGAAVVFHLLAERGVRGGKGLLTGPMVGLAFAAAAPASQLGAPSGDGALRPLLVSGAIGLIVGGSVSLGMEAGEGAARWLRSRGGKVR